jgi:outer membrane protein assembly factor BamB
MKKSVSKRWLLPLAVAGGAALGGWLAYRNRPPAIRDVTRGTVDGAIAIRGTGFGQRQGPSAVWVQTEGVRFPLQDVVSWSDRRIVALVPADVTSGSVQVARQLRFGRWVSPAAPLPVEVAGHPSQPYGYQVPAQAGSPWPTFRRDRRNSGRSPIRARYHGDRPWSFQTGKGIFSTPVIDSQGTIYVGSADHNFYAVRPDGREKWRFQSGEVIDSAGALLQTDPELGDTIVFPSGDGMLYRLRTGDGTPVWTFDARVAPRASYNNWWEAGVALGYDGTLYAGNTNFNYYAVNPDGTLKWTYETGANNWSLAAFADDGTLFWASLDTKVRAVRPDGKEKWTRRTLGFVAASAAVGSDGTVYIGSFDSCLYALDPDTGRVRWKFRTGDHVYSSAALGIDERGHTNAIYFGSTDGVLYALNPAGELLWKVDTGAPIRSSPALGRAPEGESGDVIYFGNGDGRLIALNAADGALRWSFDTTPDDAELRDRNDLNGSPSLGRSGVYIGGEHGQLWYVPYDYPLHVADPRGERDPGQNLPEDTAGLFYVTPGGNTVLGEPPPIAAATVITLRLVVRERGETVDARVCGSLLGRSRRSLQVQVEPAFPFRWEPSANGRYVHIFPEGFLEPGTAVKIRVRGDYCSGGLHLGNLTLGERRRGQVDDSVTLRVAEPTAARIPLAMAQDRVTALEWTRLAVPIPPMLPSLNQIGFDYMDWIVGVVDLGEPDARGVGKAILWAIGGRRGADGVLVADPASDFTLPLSGTYRGDAFILSNRRFELAVTGIPIPFNLFQIRGQLGPDLRVRPGATAFADTQVFSVPTFGPALLLAGLASDGWRKLLALGTYVTRPYAATGPANRRPEGISVAALDVVAPTRTQDGRAVARLRLEPGASYPLAEHRPAILLVDAAGTTAVPLDYHDNLSATADEGGNLETITLRIPAGTALPEALKAVVILDVFPLHHETKGREAGP